MLLVLFQMSHSCIGYDLNRFPVLAKRIDEVVGNFLQDGLEPAENMIREIIEMEVWFFVSGQRHGRGGEYNPRN